MNLEQVIKEKVDKISEEYDLPHKFEIVISADESISVYQGHLVDVRLEAGNPPKMIIPIMFIMRCESMDYEKGNELFTNRIWRALQKYSRMERTLRHNIPHDRALVWINDPKRKGWQKTYGLTQTTKPAIPKEDLEITYMVSIKDKITGLSFTAVSNKSGEDAKNEAITRLTNIVFANEEIEEFRDLAKKLADIPQIEAKQEPEVVLITTQYIKKEDVIIEQVNERQTYDDRAKSENG